MAIVLSPGERDPKRFNDAIRQLTEGRQNSVGDVTLRANFATTTVIFENCSKDCRIFLFPQTANAAAAVATTRIPLTSIAQGSFTITHANDALADKAFSFLCIGG